MSGGGEPPGSQGEGGGREGEREKNVKHWRGEGRKGWKSERYLHGEVNSRQILVFDKEDSVKGRSCDGLRIRKGDLVDSRWEDSPIYSLYGPRSTLTHCLHFQGVIYLVKGMRSLLRTASCFHLAANATEIRLALAVAGRPVSIASAVRLNLAAHLG